MAAPTLRSMVLCHRINQDPQTRLFTLHDVFDSLWLDAVPASRPVSLFCSLTDAPQGDFEVRLEFRLLQEDGDKLLAFVEARHRQAVAGSYNFGINLAQLPFPVGGSYSLEVFVDRLWIGRHSMDARFARDGTP